MFSLANNKQAFFEYEILDKLEAGIVLTGHEVRSVKMGRADLVGSRAIIRDGEIFLVGLSISSFQAGNAPSDYDPARTRKLLLREAEINKLIGKLQEGFGLIPTRLFVFRNLVKVELGLGKRKKKYDKREAIKKREVEREIRRKVKS